MQSRAFLSQLLVTGDESGFFYVFFTKIMQIECRTIKHVLEIVMPKCGLSYPKIVVLFASFHRFPIFFRGLYSLVVLFLTCYCMFYTGCKIGENPEKCKI